ncbi:unnamed protein product [Durusdinium trenchii]|uniref:Uncharacterized protein n=1 Tax=Durusdinium trenchii TaxID=1381693 RepID=A0ABP0PY07_9DINO
MRIFESLLVAVTALDHQCHDPLYKAHWFGEYGSATVVDSQREATLSSIPTVHKGLKLCPKYNMKASCCSVAFEEVLARHYNYFQKHIFPSKLVRVIEHHQSVLEVMKSEEYQAATRLEKEQFAFALERFSPVLQPKVHSDCWSAMLTYTAGMSCFACKPDWMSYVTPRCPPQCSEVLRVHIHPEDCEELWIRCESFSLAARALREALLDSLLAKQARKPVEDLTMFEDQQAEKEANLFADCGQREQASPLEPRDARILFDVTSQFLRVMDEGRASNFDTHSPGAGDGSHARRAHAAGSLALLSGAVWLRWLGD